MKKILKKTASFFLVLLLFFCVVSAWAGTASGQDKDHSENGLSGDDAFLFGEDNGMESESSSETSDSIESINRAMFVFNDKMYFWLFKPVAQGYKFVTPDFFRTGVRNFFKNITTPGRLAGCIMQGKRERAEAEIARFLVNSTFGLGGIFDITSHIKEMNPAEEDPGQALGSYGIGNGFYIVWPFLGSSTLRDTAGKLISIGIDPVTYIDMPAEAYLSMRVFDTVNGVSDRIGDYEAIKEAAFDPYIMVRDGYLQRRRAQVSD